MSDQLRLHELPPSPNCVKVRLALGYKGLDYERVPIEPGDRASVVTLSGQPRTPVLEHGDTVLFDSSAIVRYLDANFRDRGPRLFTEDYDGMGAIEEWERYSFEVRPPVGQIFRQFFSGQKDADASAAAGRALNDTTGRFEERLTVSPWLYGEAPTAADFTCAPFVRLACLTAADVADSPILAHFRENLELGAGRDRTRDWVARAMAFDR